MYISLPFDLVGVFGILKVETLVAVPCSYKSVECMISVPYIWTTKFYKCSEFSSDSCYALQIVCFAHILTSVWVSQLFVTVKI